MSFTPNTTLTVPDHKLEEMRGEHGKIIRKVLSAFKAKEVSQKSENKDVF